MFESLCLKITSSQASKPLDEKGSCYCKSLVGESLCNYPQFFFHLMSIVRSHYAVVMNVNLPAIFMYSYHLSFLAYS